MGGATRGDRIDNMVNEIPHTGRIATEFEEAV